MRTTARFKPAARPVPPSAPADEMDSLREWLDGPRKPPNPDALVCRPRPTFTARLRRIFGAN
jgi:hypothetical protein